MKRHRTPAAAAVALLIAGCSKAPPETSATPSPTATDRTVLFADCMRRSGVKAFPDTNGLSDQKLVEAIEALDPSSAGFKRALGACQDLQPPGLLGAKASPRQMSDRLRFAACMREHGVEDFPDPANGEPLVDTNRIPSSAAQGGMATLNAAMRRCRDVAADALGNR